MDALPHGQRKRIPFYTDKTEAEFTADPYEHYDSLVKRQIQLHLGGLVTEAAPWQAVTDWVMKQLPANLHGQVLEIGCSVGTLIAEVAATYPHATCHGFDFSYQLLKVADAYWCNEQAVECEDSRGFTPLYIGPRVPLPNLSFGLARAEKLPFPDNYLDIVISSFLFDRLEHPMLAVEEWKRVLKPGGLLLIVTPLNFQRQLHWEAFYPEARFFENFKVAGWNLRQQSKMTVTEALDVRGNAVVWKCVAAAWEAESELE